MNTYRDAILYIPDFQGLVSYLLEHNPDCVDMTHPSEPVVRGMARTPATINGNAILVYTRMNEEQVAQWRGTPGVDVLAEHEYVGKGTGDLVYQLLFDDPEATAKYDSVYSREPYEVDDGEGGSTTVTPPQRFGVMA